MSYNQIKVDSKKANVDGSITLNLDDVASLTPSDGDALVYDNNAWGASKIPAGIGFDRTLYTTYSGFTFNNTYYWEIPNPYLPSGDQYFLQIAPEHWKTTTVIVTFNKTSEVSLTKVSGSYTYVHKFTINTAGVYRLFAKVELHPNSSATSSMTVQWSNADNTTTYGPQCRLKRSQGHSVPVVGIINASVGDEFGLYMKAITNSPRATGTFFNTIVNFERLS